MTIRDWKEKDIETGIEIKLSANDMVNMLVEMDRKDRLDIVFEATVARDNKDSEQMKKWFDEE